MLTNNLVINDTDNDLSGILEGKVLGVGTPWLIGGSLMFLSLILFFKKKKRYRR